jgi:hypothetical protein
MPRFLATVVFSVELEDVRDGGRRLRQLAEAANEVGFELRGAEMREDDAPEPSAGWKAYAPE